MVYVKLVNDSVASQRAIRRVVERRGEIRSLATKLLKSISAKGLEAPAALRARQAALMTSSNSSLPMVNAQRSNIDMLFPSVANGGSWSSALDFLQQQVVEPGLELTSDHAQRIISLWARENTARPPASLLYRWWTLLSLDRPHGFDDRVKGEESPAQRLLPVVAGVISEYQSAEQALGVIANEVAVTGASPQMSLAIEEAIAASVDPNTKSVYEQRAIDSCLISLGESAVGCCTSTIGVLATSGGLLRTAVTKTRGVPSFSVSFSRSTGTLTKSSDTEERCVFNGVASAIVASRPNAQEGVRLCDSFIEVTSANTSCVLEELKLRYLTSVDTHSALSFFDSIPEFRRTPFMTAVCLRVLVANGVYDGAVVYARSMCEAWGSFTIPSSALNRLCTMRDPSNHSEAFWALMNLCSDRVSEAKAKAIANHRLKSPWSPKILPVDEIIVNLQDLASLGKVPSARAVMSRLPSVPRSRVGSSEESLTLELLEGLGDDWRLALEALQHPQSR